MNVGSTIKAIRKQMNQNQAEFAEGLGMAQTTISNLESDPTPPPYNSLKKISAYSGVPIPLIYVWSTEPDDLPEANQDIWPTVEGMINHCFNISSTPWPDPIDLVKYCKTTKKELWPTVSELAQYCLNNKEN